MASQVEDYKRLVVVKDAEIAELRAHRDRLESIIAKEIGVDVPPTGKCSRCELRAAEATRAAGRWPGTRYDYGFPFPRRLCERDDGDYVLFAEAAAEIARLNGIIDAEHDARRAAEAKEAES